MVPPPFLIDRQSNSPWAAQSGIHGVVMPIHTGSGMVAHGSRFRRLLPQLCGEVYTSGEWKAPPYQGHSGGRNHRKTQPLEFDGTNFGLHQNSVALSAHP